MGNTSVPCPCTTRVPPKPYTMSASCGPALRYSLAIPLIRNRMTITPSPAKIQIVTKFDKPNIMPPPNPRTFTSTAKQTLALTRSQRRGSRALFCGLRLFARHLAPQTNIGNALLVTGDHNLGSLGNGAPIVSARATNSTRSHLGIDKLASSARADGNADSPQHSHHLVVGWIHIFLVRNQHLAQKQEHDGCPHQSSYYREH